MSDVPTVNIGNAPVRTMCFGRTKNAHKAAGNLLISSNYPSRGTSGGLKGFVSARERSKIEPVTFCSAESKTNKEGDNGAQENDNPGGGVFNPHSSLPAVKQSDGSMFCYFFKNQLFTYWNIFTKTVLVKSYTNLINIHLKITTTFLCIIQVYND